MEGQRCLKLFWLRRYRPDLAAAPDKQTLHLFETGRIVGEIARKLFPEGIMIGVGSFQKLVVDTETALKMKSPYYYEAAFESEGMRCRTDILCSKNNTLNIKEVKMCSKVKDENIKDVAFQAYCIERAGHEVDRLSLVHVNNGYIRQDKIKPEGLLVEEDITAEVKVEIPNVPGKLKNLISMLESPEPPKIIIGPQCIAPGKCPYFDLCHAEIIKDSIYYLPNGTRKIPELVGAGIIKLSDVPITADLTSRQAAAVKSAILRTPVVNVAEIQQFLQQLTNPIYYLDFETIAPSIPAFDGASPYEKIPFQYSLHVQAHEDKLQHFEFLPENSADPRQSLLMALLDRLGNRGSIICWNMAFEKSVLKNLGCHYSQYQERIQSLQDRFVDLMVPFKSGLYVDYRFCGSSSLKKVLPILCPELAYDDLQIQHGDDASLVYQKFIEGAMSESEWIKLRPHMLAYCGLDTYGMVEIFNVLKNCL